MLAHEKLHLKCYEPNLIRESIQPQIHPKNWRCNQRWRSMRHFLVISAIKFHSNVITFKVKFVEQFRSYQMMCIVFDLRHTWPAKLLISSIVDSSKMEKEGSHAVTLRLNASSSRTQKHSDREQKNQEPSIDVPVYYAAQNWANNRCKIASNVCKFRPKMTMHSNYSSMCTEERRRVAGVGWRTHVAGNHFFTPFSQWGATLLSWNSKYEPLCIWSRSFLSYVNYAEAKRCCSNSWPAFLLSIYLWPYNT